MNRTRNKSQTRNFTAPRRSTRTISSSSESVPKTFTATTPRSSGSNSAQIKTFTNRVNSKAYVPAPPKFLQRSGGRQVKPAEEATTAKTKSVFKKTTSSTLRRHSKTELKQLATAEEDLTHTASESDEQPEDANKEKLQEKEKPKIRRHDPLVYRSKNCTFNQDYLSMLTFEPKLEDLALSDEEEKEEAPKATPRARTFKPYVKKEQSSGFGFWSSGLEDSLLSGSGFSYKPAVAKKPLPKRTNEGDKKNVLPPTLPSSSAFSSSPMFF